MAWYSDAVTGERAFIAHVPLEQAVFTVACPCGTDTYLPLAVVDDDNNLQPPNSLECTGCDQITKVFDPARHGRDGGFNPIRRDIGGVDNELGGDLQILVRFECS